MSPPIDPTPRSDYAHWNEDQDYMWWEEVGKHAASQANEPPDPDAWYESWEADDPEGEAEEDDEGPDPQQLEE